MVAPRSFRHAAAKTARALSITVITLVTAAVLGFHLILANGQTTPASPIPTSSKSPRSRNSPTPQPTGNQSHNQQSERKHTEGKGVASPEFISAMAAVAALLLSGATIWVTSVIEKTKQREEWNHEFRSAHEGYWQSEALSEVRSWIVHEDLYQQNLARVLELRKCGRFPVRRYSTLEKLDQFCASLTRVLYLMEWNMKELAPTLLSRREDRDASKHKWSILERTYGFWFRACAQQPLVTEYMDYYWTDLHSGFNRIEDFRKQLSDIELRHWFQFWLRHRMTQLTRQFAEEFAKPLKHGPCFERWLLSSKACPVLSYRDPREIGCIDLAQTNPELAGINDPRGLQNFIEGQFRKSRKNYLAGGYGEKRSIYERIALYITAEGQQRNTHLGIDIWGRAGDAVYSPLAGQIHSCANNKADGDYGPTIIVEHKLWDTPIYSLFGHLTQKSLDGLYDGKMISAGARIGSLGDSNENGKWPPHLHYQLICNIGCHKGDYPGVATEAGFKEQKENCPCPNLLLKLPLVRCPCPKDKCGRHSPGKPAGANVA